MHFRWPSSQGKQEPSGLHVLGISANFQSEVVLLINCAHIWESMEALKEERSYPPVYFNCLFAVTLHCMWHIEPVWCRLDMAQGLGLGHMLYTGSGASPNQDNRLTLCAELANGS